MIQLWRILILLFFVNVTFSQPIIQNNLYQFKEKRYAEENTAYSMESALKKKKKVLYFEVYFDSLTENITQLRHIETILFDGYHFKNFQEIPLYKLPNLKYISTSYDGTIYSNTIFDSIPPNITNCKKIKSLSICPYKNIPFHLGSKFIEMKNLKHIKVYRNNMDMTASLKIISCMQNVEILEFFECDSIFSIKALSEMKNLKCLNFNSCKIAQIDSFWQHLAQIKSLKSLKLSDCDIKIVPPEIKRLTNLRHIDLSETDIEVLPVEIKSLTKLKSLDLSSIKNLNYQNIDGLNIKYIDLSFCGIKNIDNIKLKKLHYIDLMDNNISEIPSFLYFSPNLVYVSLYKKKMNNKDNGIEIITYNKRQIKKWRSSFLPPRSRKCCYDGW